MCLAVAVAVGPAVWARLRFVAGQTFARMVVGGVHHGQARLIFAGAGLATGRDRVKITGLEMGDDPIDAVSDRLGRLAVDHRYTLAISIVQPCLSGSDFAGHLF